ncbi:hypothetical protein B0A48_03098 [Cryoendolithus antarcticus]|uniref:Mediator of RNA polymerase II transcription subunit 9 n=1 Tax=Cryoendolithus antarcticus TaxID=1507870 RepID=A0A1V8TM64_9PEZI|nr:hypothetical protein B0A48_03098 [Cryoendolithus antarcticus]
MATNSFTTANTSFSASQPPLPPPQTFDILPALHELLSHIDHAPSTDPAVSLTLLPSPPTEDEITYTDLKHLEPKDLPREVGEIKAKIRKALREIEKLSDVERSVEEQEDEIAELEGRIGRQKAELRRLGDVGRGLIERG